MRRFSVFASLCVGAAMVFGCAPGPRGLRSAELDLTTQLMEWAPGTYVSEGPVGEYSEPLVVHVARLPEFSRAFYVEAAPASAVDEPVVQFVWYVLPDAPPYGLETYRLTRLDDFVNAWASEEKLLLFSMYYLRLQEGCDLELEFDGSAFGGDLSRGDGAGCFCDAVSFEKEGLVWKWEGGFGGDVRFAREKAGE